MLSYVFFSINQILFLIITSLIKILDLTYIILSRLDHFIANIPFLPKIIFLPLRLFFIICKFIVKTISYILEFTVHLIFKLIVTFFEKLALLFPRLFKDLFNIIKSHYLRNKIFSTFYPHKIEIVNDYNEYESVLLKLYQRELNALKTSFEKVNKDVSNIKNINLIDLQFKESNLLSNYMASVLYTRMMLKRNFNIEVKEPIVKPCLYFTHIPIGSY